MIVPTIGRIVLYTMPSWCAEQVNRRREAGARCIAKHQWQNDGTMVHVGNHVDEGRVYPAMVVAVWGDTPTAAVNLKVMLDGSDDLWVTSTSVEDERHHPDGKPIHTPGRYHWPHQVGQAKKHADEKPAS